jgi:hypothetical protein
MRFYFLLCIGAFLYGIVPLKAGVHSGFESKNPLKDLILTATVYETSPGLKELLYATTCFHFKGDGHTKLDVVAGPAGSKLGSRGGFATLLSKEMNTLVFLHEDEAFANPFTNVLYFSSDHVGELVATHQDQYVKCYVKIDYAE